MMAEFPAQLTTDRLQLARPQTADFDELLRFATNEQVALTMGGVATAEQVRAALQRRLDHWERYGFGWWTMRDRVSGAFVDRGGVRHCTIAGKDEVELGYGLVPEFWAQGLAAEMSREALRLGFDQLGLASIVAFTLPTNRRSQRVMEKLGFTYECDTTHANLPHVLYRLTAEEWRAIRLA
jgi:RimJ/RimL family protein N-acetyltransferase